MTQDHSEILAAEYVLGTLEADARDRFRRALEQDPKLQSLVASWQERLGALADRHTSEVPSARVWAAIAAGIDETPLPNTTTIRAAEGSWQTVSAGAAIKVLFENPDDGYRSFLLRMEPGGRLPGHVHAYTEECLVLEGELIIGETRYVAGDFHVAHPGSRHQDLTSESGGLVYVRTSMNEAHVDAPPA